MHRLPRMQHLIRHRHIFAVSCRSSHASSYCIAQAQGPGYVWLLPQCRCLRRQLGSQCTTMRTYLLCGTACSAQHKLAPIRAQGLCTLGLCRKPPAPFSLQLLDTPRSWHLALAAVGLWSAHHVILAYIIVNGVGRSLCLVQQHVCLAMHLTHG